MKNILLFFVLLLAYTAEAQILEPVKWRTSVNKISNNEYELVATAFIDKGWHLYSQVIPEDGPKPTIFNYQASPNYFKKGYTIEGSGHTTEDPIFEMKIKYFDVKAEFKQRIKVKGQTPFTINGSVNFMVCDDTRCLPPTDVDLAYNIE